MVDQSDQPISTEGYLEARERAALQGQVYNPEVGFALVGNTGERTEVSLQPVLRRIQPAHRGGVEPAVRQRFDGGQDLRP